LLAAPRTIEGPLYVAGAPLAQGEVRMDDGSDPGVVMFLRARCSMPTASRWPVPRRPVARQHPGHLFVLRPSQSEYNLRRRIVTDAEGRYRARSIVPSGYGCDPQADPGVPGPARPPRPAPGARALLHLGAGAPSPDHADQLRGRQVPVGRLRLRHP
jgi:hypothetical protein